MAAGSKPAMRALYERHHDAVFAFIRGRSGDEAVAADVVQDAMLEVWRSAGKFKNQSTVKTWIFGIARNKLHDRFRKSARFSFVDEVPETEDEGPTPEAAAIAASDVQRVRDCLAKLKEGYRSVIRLAFYEDLTYPEIGEIEGVPVGTIKSRIHHAKRLLMQCLGGR